MHMLYLGPISLKLFTSKQILFACKQILFAYCGRKTCIWMTLTSWRRKCNSFFKWPRQFDSILCIMIVFELWPWLSVFLVCVWLNHHGDAVVPTMKYFKPWERAHFVQCIPSGKFSSHNWVHYVPSCVPVSLIPSLGPFLSSNVVY